MILEPSGEGWPLPGAPALYISIMVGLATITLSTSSIRAEDHRSVLVSVGERDSARRLQRVLVLRVNGRAAQDGERCCAYRNRELAFALHG
jgi:hypothetical protein